MDNQTISNIIFHVWKKLTFFGKHSQFSWQKAPKFQVLWRINTFHESEVSLTEHVPNAKDDNPLCFEITIHITNQKKNLLIWSFFTTISKRVSKNKINLVKQAIFSVSCKHSKEKKSKENKECLSSIRRVWAAERERMWKRNTSRSINGCHDYKKVFLFYCFSPLNS